MDKRWEQIQEISSMYGDEEMPEGNEFREIPKNKWHDKKYVEEWIDKAKERRDRKIKDAR